MPDPTLLDYANICATIYNDNKTGAAGGWSRTYFLKKANGFQGGIFTRSNGQGLDFVVAFAGTQIGQDGNVDAIADIGFGGMLSKMVGMQLIALGGPLGMVLGGTAMAGGSTLESQLSDCKATLGRAMQTAAGVPGSRLLLTGHSLGGGLAQITAARAGVPAVPISAPSVTRVSGVSGDYSRTQPKITCLKIQNDPINSTHNIGSLLGTVWTLPSGRTGMDAHSIDKTAAELSPGGTFASTGSRIPI